VTAARLARRSRWGRAARFTHLHPYMTGDNQWVVFNSDRTGVPQVYIAEAPADFLKSLN
jgi:Tol biopolymer transport system component